MSLKIATPVSTLFATSSRVAEMVALSDALEVRELSTPVASDLPRLYHCDLTLTELWDETQLAEALRIINDNNVILVSFHLASCYSRPSIKDGMFQPDSQPLRREDIINTARTNIAAVRQNINPAIVLAVENNNYYSTGAYEIVTEPAFINTLLNDLDLRLLLDIGHAQVTAYNQGKKNADQYITAFDLNRVCQIHLSRPIVVQDVCRDTHEAPEPADWQYAKKVFLWCPNLRFVTIEYYKNDEQLIASLKQLRTIIHE